VVANNGMTAAQPSVVEIVKGCAAPGNYQLRHMFTNDIGLVAVFEDSDSILICVNDGDGYPTRGPNGRRRGGEWALHRGIGHSDGPACRERRASRPACDKNGTLLDRIAF
jgi:hypothetical protein